VKKRGGFGGEALNDLFGASARCTARGGAPFGGKKNHKKKNPKRRSAVVRGAFYIQQSEKETEKGGLTTDAA